MEYKLKNNFKQSITKQVRNRRADRDSDPYRDGGWCEREKLNCDKDRPPATTIIERDRSGLGKMGGTVVNRARDQYKAVAEQQGRLRKQQLAAIDSGNDVDPKEFKEYLISQRKNPADYGY